MDVKELIRQLLDEIHTISKTETVVGEPLIVGKSKIIPISKLSLGFGVGGVNTHAQAESGENSEASSSGGGAGGGVKVQPLAFVVVDPEGGAQLLCLDEPEASVIDKILNVAPELADQIMNRLGVEDREALDAGEGNSEEDAGEAPDEGE